MDNLKSSSKKSSSFSLYSSKSAGSPELCGYDFYVPSDDAEVNNFGQASPSELTTRSNSSYSFVPNRSSNSLSSPSSCKSISSLPRIATPRSMSSLSDYSIGRKDATIASQSSHNLLTMKPPAPVAAWMEDKRISPLSALEVRQKAKEQLAEEEAIKSGQYKALERERQQATEDAVSAEKACAAIDRLSLIARVPPMLFESSNALIQSLG